MSVSAILAKTLLPLKASISLLRHHSSIQKYISDHWNVFGHSIASQ